MGENELLIYIHQYGYVALFFCLWLGIVGMPIPDEMIVATGGFVSSIGMLKLVPAFMITYLGVVTGLSLGFVLGRILEKKVVDRVMKRKAKYYIKAEEITQKYGNIALIFSYFIPVVRHIVPYIVGMNKMTFKRYSIYSYSTAFIWTMIYFILGFTFGDHIETIVHLGTKYGLVFGILIIGGVIYFVNDSKDV